LDAVADHPLPSSEGRSANMRANRRTDTKPEMALRRALHGRGYRYRKDYRLDLAPGQRVRPDIAFTARRVAVFVDGCFWHACPEHGTKPAANTWYWDPKLRRNVERDRAADAALAAAGWEVVRVWEHVPLEAAVTAVIEALARSRSAGQAGLVAEEAGLVAEDSGLASGPAGLVAEDAGLVAEDAGLASGPVGLVAEDAGLVSGPAEPGAGQI
jgi:DNA mismatch endonuclease (patch repair protein)